MTIVGREWKGSDSAWMVVWKGEMDQGRSWLPLHFDYYSAASSYILARTTRLGRYKRWCGCSIMIIIVISGADARGGDASPASTSHSPHGCRYSLFQIMRHVDMRCATMMMMFCDEVRLLGVCGDGGRCGSLAILVKPITTRLPCMNLMFITYVHVYV